MRFIYTFLFLISSFIFAEAEAVSTEALNKKGNFIENVQSSDPQVQRMLEQLREDYNNQRDQVNRKYDDKKKRLKDQKKQEMEQLRNSFKSKLDKIRNQYPNEIKKKKKAKSLDKSNRKHLTPIGNDENIIKKRKKLPSKKKDNIKSKKIKRPLDKKNTTSETPTKKVKPKEGKDLSK